MPGTRSRAFPLSRLREREGAHPEGMGRVRDSRVSEPSLTLALLRNGSLVDPPCGSTPLAGEGLSVIGTAAKLWALR